MKDILLCQLEDRIKELEFLSQNLKSTDDTTKKINFLLQNELVKEYLQHPLDHLEKYSSKYSLVIFSIIAIGQESSVFNPGRGSIQKERLEDLLDTLSGIEDFYKTIGGIVGYHVQTLRLIFEQNSAAYLKNLQNDYRYIKPHGTDISKENRETLGLLRKGIESMGLLAEIYPVGGAGDRLDLRNETTGDPLPAAMLPFFGRTLLEGLVRDLQAREYLYSKLFGKKITVPIAMMTSHEKNNHAHILEIMEKHDWFGRSKESFSFFVQPLAPVITCEGNWALSAPFTLHLKPGGHGVLWKVADDNQIFAKFKKLGKRKALVRQINNPIASTDYGILAFTGLGFLENKSIGFASCPRQVNSAEGVNVLIEHSSKQGYEYILTNIEYSEFSKKGISDCAESEEKPFSIYPANTNILFVDLEAVQQMVKTFPFPGMNINMKNTVLCMTPTGESKEIKAGRLETTMQNISDCSPDVFDHRLQDDEYGKIKNFLTYNERRKTISVTKKSYVAEKPLLETPEGCFYDWLLNAHDLLTNYCIMKVPSLNEKEYVTKGPAFAIYYHPALGPLYSMIAQKMRGGEMAKGSELSLEIAEVYINNLKLDGSLHIVAKTLLGEVQNTGKCILENVTVKNAGIDKSQEQQFWKHALVRKELCSIILHGNAEFVAQDIVLEGNHSIEVPSGHRMTALQEKGKVVFKLEKIEKPTWHWDYAFDDEDRIILSQRK